ncbi:hypothetical protein GCM10009654_64910 [Streptomyces hebeiensis]|uniref:Uncharacterized protein n=1 Tax=Streptomyces hebeiensis TaxID=229486 RepID=A0ABN1V826_9ACTN
MTYLLTSRPLDGRVDVVTGASSGMGAATARRLAELGAFVAVIARRQEKLASLAADITAAGGKAIPLSVDVTDRAAVPTAADEVADTLGPADLVFNNAGVQLIYAPAPGAAGPAPIPGRPAAPSSIRVSRRTSATSPVSSVSNWAGRTCE